MPLLILAFFVSFSSMAVDNERQVIGKTFNCDEDITIEAKVGGHNVYVIDSGKEYILFPQGNYAFKKESAFTLIYDSYNRKGNQEEEPRFLYTHPSTGDKRIGELKIFNNDERTTCDVKQD
jgi:hypothetical protein